MKKHLAFKPAEWSVNKLSLESGLDRRTIVKLLANVAPVRSEGQKKFYSLRQFAEAIRQNPLTEFRRESLLKLKAERQIKETDLAERRKDLIPMAELIDRAVKIMVPARQLWESMPVNLPDKLEGKSASEMEAILRQSVSGILTALTDLHTYKEYAKANTDTQPQSKPAPAEQNSSK